MVISQSEATFCGLPVERYHAGGAFEPTQYAYRVGQSHEDRYSGPEDIKAAFDADLAAILAEPRLGELRALLTGPWEEAIYDDPATHVAQALIEAAPRLTGLRGLFFCDVPEMFAEISWLPQLDVGPLINAFGRLERFAARGYGIGLSDIDNPALLALTVETGGLPAEAARQLGGALLPSLERLDLWIGEENYGRTCAVEDLAPILSGKLFPKLKHLGLQNGDITGDIAQAIVNAPVLAQLETLDLSMGTLTDAQAEVLLDSPGVKALKHLDLSENFLTEAMGKRLETLGCDVRWDSGKDVEYAIESEWFYVTHGE